MKILALIIDFRTTAEAERLSLQVARSDLSRCPGSSVIVAHVDNGNQPAVALSEAQKAAGIQLLRLSANSGYGGGLVQAIQALDPDRRFDAYWFLNSDLEVEPDTLGRLVDGLQADGQAAAIGPTVFLGRSPVVWGARGVISPLTGTTAMTSWPKGGRLPRWSYIPGSSLLVRSAAYFAVGGLPTRYRMYYEETELCVRLQKAGWFLRVAPEARAYHAVRSREDKIPARHFAYYFARNNLYFWKNNFGVAPWIQFPRLLVVALKELVLPLRRAPSYSVFQDRFGYVVAGLLDSFQFLREERTAREQRLFGP